MGRIEFREADELVSALQKDVSGIISELRSEEKNSLLRLAIWEPIKEAIYMGGEIKFYDGYGRLVYSISGDSLESVKRRGLRRLAGIIEDKIGDYN